jgi:hypothetical protein
MLRQNHSARCEKAGISTEAQYIRALLREIRRHWSQRRNCDCLLIMRGTRSVEKGAWVRLLTETTGEISQTFNSRFVKNLTRSNRRYSVPIKMIPT